MIFRSVTALAIFFSSTASAFSPPHQQHTHRTLGIRHAERHSPSDDRRQFLLDAASVVVGSGAILASSPAPSLAAVDVDGYLKSGQVSMPMGVSGQAGKARPITGIVLREGSDISRDTRTGNVVAEILLTPYAAAPQPVLATFTSPWPLATGPLFDVECRDAKTGDGVFLSVSSRALPGTLASVPKEFFLEELFRSTGRFSFYGAPTDVKVKKDDLVGGGNNGDYRYLELSFSNLSQSTNAEIPRRAIVAVTVPKGSEEAVMLVASATAARYKKGVEEDVRKTAMSFQAVPAPQSGLKVRPKERS